MCHTSLQNPSVPSHCSQKWKALGLAFRFVCDLTSNCFLLSHRALIWILLHSPRHLSHLYLFLECLYLHFLASSKSFLNFHLKMTSAFFKLSWCETSLPPRAVMSYVALYYSCVRGCYFSFCTGNSVKPESLFFFIAVLHMAYCYAHSTCFSECIWISELIAHLGIKNCMYYSVASCNDKWTSTS